MRPVLWHSAWPKCILKRWIVGRRCSKWLILSCTLPLHLNFHSLSSSSQSEAKVRYCLAHTYKTSRFTTLTPDFSFHLWTQPGVINKPHLGHKLYQSRKKIKAGHCAEDNGRQKFPSNFPQPVFGTTSIHNSKLLRWCLQNMMSLPT